MVVFVSYYLLEKMPQKQMSAFALYQQQKDTKVTHPEKDLTKEGGDDIDAQKKANKLASAVDKNENGTVKSVAENKNKKKRKSVAATKTEKKTAPVPKKRQADEAQTDTANSDAKKQKPAEKEEEKSCKDNGATEQPEQAEVSNTNVTTKEKSKKKKKVAPMKKNLPNFPSFPKLTGDSVSDGKAAFQWLINPIPLKTFFNKHWEKEYLLVKRDSSTFINNIFTMKDFNEILKSGKMDYSVNLDITSYEDGERTTENPSGKAHPAVAWQYYQSGCSLRIKNPQSFSPSVLKLCSTLQEHFKSMVGANIYLTPPGTQGFAPHYDDIEAFVLQLEGKKEWKVYRPRDAGEVLPKYSSNNFDQEEIGKEILTTTLEAGDILYFPRGFIHQAKSLPDVHSLHITISTYQCNTWHDVMKEMLNTALQKAVENDVEFRRGIPLNFLDQYGTQYADEENASSPGRVAIANKIADLFNRLRQHADIDDAADQRAVSFLHDSLPPVLTKDEQSRMVQGVDSFVASKKSSQQPTIKTVEIGLETKLKLVRKNSIRIDPNTEQDEEDCVRVYHNLENPTVYHAEEKKYILVELSKISGLDCLLQNYPNFVKVDDFPLENDELKILLANELFDHGMVMSEKKLPTSVLGFADA